jgi:hypothetical protein
MCGNESMVAGVDMGNLIALDTAALEKERLGAAPESEAASCAASQMRRRKIR